MILLFISLLTGLIKLEMIDDISKFLLDHLAFFFVPAGVGLLAYVGILKANLIPILVICFATTFLVMIVTGWGIIYKKSTFGKWLGAKYNDVALILLNIVLVFAVLNVIAAIVLFKPEKLPETGSYIHSPADLLKDSIGFMRQVYPGRSDDEIRELVMFRSPYVNHPILEFQEKIQNSKYYNVGFEDIRYDRKVNRENASKYINGSVWVFGGSTTFGQGVSDNETISAFLNMLDTSNTYLNFGVHAYHQSNEIEKLLLLLKKGYKPKSVIFIDGLNDVIRMIETNFHPMETPSLAKI
jgi:holin-like protein